MNRIRHRIVLTGGPASGKSETLVYLKTLNKFSRFCFFDELARSLLHSKPEYRCNWHQFHLDLYRLQSARENELANSRDFFTDRGTVDAFAFHPETIKAVGTTIEDEYQRYSLVIQMGSAAQLGQAYYVTDQIRNESIEEALAIEEACKNIWQNHPHYHFLRAETEESIKRTKVMKLLERYVTDE